jgi:hypothetical protein
LEQDVCEADASPIDDAQQKKISIRSEAGWLEQYLPEAVDVPVYVNYVALKRQARKSCYIGYYRIAEEDLKKAPKLADEFKTQSSQAAWSNFWF